MSRILTELRQRKLVHWTVAYLATAWVTLQVVALLAEGLEWQGVVLRITIALVAAGFLATLILAWYHGEQGRQRVSATELLMLTAVLLIAGVAVYWARGARASAVTVATPPESTAARPEYRASIAVLPFDDLTGKQESYFSEGLTEEIISRLAEISGLKVISRHSAVVLKRSGLTLPQIADSLRVRHVLEGSVRRSNGSVRVTAQLIDPRTDTHLWSESFDRDYKDILAVQEEIAHRVSAALLRSVNVVRSSNTRAVLPEAFDAYLRGTQAVGTRTQAGLQQAVTAFGRAIALDSTFAPANAGLSEAHATFVTMGYRSSTPAYERAARALLHADRAIALDSASPDGYAARGYIRQWAWSDSSQILSDFRRALQLQPNSGRTRLWYATALGAFGRDQDALREAAVAAELDPLIPRTHYAYSGIALAAGDYQLAFAEAERAQLLEPNLIAPRRRKLYALILLKRGDECVRFLEGTPLGIQAVCWELAGNEEKAAELIERASTRSFRETAAFEEYEAVATYYAWRGDVTRCVEWLERGTRLSPYVLNPRVTGSAFYDRMWVDPAFRRAYQRMQEEVRQRVAAEVKRLQSASN